MFKKVKKYRFKLLVMLLLILLISSNISWFIIYKEQRVRVKNSLIPSLNSDYYTNQLILTKNSQIYSEINGNFDDTSYLNNTVKNVPLINQNPKYPNGCEAASAVMLLNYYGIKITLDEFINYLPKNKVYTENGSRFGPNPAEAYAGDPTSETKGWGCFDKVIAETMEKIIKDKKSNIAVIRENKKAPLSELVKNFPVMIWTTIDYEIVDSVFTWFSYDSKEIYTYPKNEHAVILTGFDEHYYYINDPLKKEKNIPVLKEKLENSFDSLGRQFIYLTSFSGKEE